MDWPVASDLPGMRELLPNATQARLVPNDATALALALRQLVESPALRTSLGRAARQRYEQHYTAERMGIEVMATYQSAPTCYCRLSHVCVMIWGVRCQPRFLAEAVNLPATRPWPGSWGCNPLCSPGMWAIFLHS